MRFLFGICIVVFPERDVSSLYSNNDNSEIVIKNKNYTTAWQSVEAE